MIVEDYPPNTSQHSSSFLFDLILGYSASQCRDVQPIFNEIAQPDMEEETCPAM